MKLIYILLMMLIPLSAQADKLDKQIDKAEKHLPYMVDEQTQLISIERLGGSQIELNHILINYEASEIDAENFKRVMPGVLFKNACKDSLVKKAIKKDISAIYSYYGNEGEEIASFEINKQFCKK